MVNGNALATVGCKYLGTPYATMDCQAFVEKCLRDCGLKKDLSGSNAWYREVAAHGFVGSPEECKSKYGFIPKGAFLFILLHDGGEPSKYKVLKWSFVSTLLTSGFLLCEMILMNVSLAFQ